MKTLIVAPHPDDELLGCGGTLLRRVSDGGIVGWLLMTAITSKSGCSIERVDQRACEIDQVRKGLCIAPHNLYQLKFPTAELDQFAMGELVEEISKVFVDFEPDEVFLPHPGDIHSDHRVVFESASACTKWFRYPSVKRVLTYETLSETNFSLTQPAINFCPNLYIDISNHLEKKLQLLSVYRSELGEHPFPRSLEIVKAQALLRGSQRGSVAAEAFQILRQFE